MRSRPLSPWVAVALAGALSGAWACGRKGPPAAPFVRIPAEVQQLAARRVGQDVFVTLTIPVENVDASVPVAIERVDVYGYTGRIAPPPQRWAQLGALVATIPVVPPLPLDSGLTVAEPLPGATPGGAVTIRDTLTPDELVQGRTDPVPPRIVGPPGTVTPLADEAEPVLQRFYLAVPFSPRGRPGPPSVPAEMPLVPIPEAPAGIEVSYRADAVSVVWEPSGGLIGYLLDRQIPLEASPVGQGLAVAGVSAAPAVPDGPTTYNVYRETSADPLALPGRATARAAWNQPPPAPLNAMPLQAFTLDDAIVFGREQCYQVRAVRGTAARLVESEPSSRVCVTPVDTFPPAPPAAPAAIGSPGAISLVWEPNTDLDLAGYLVLRGEPGDATLQPLTPVPISEARFRDTDVTTGTRYVYAVVAVDNRVPVGNRSAASPRVEETAR